MQLKVSGEHDKAITFAESLKGLSMPGYKGIDKRGEVKIDLKDNRDGEEAFELIRDKVRNTGLTIQKIEVERGSR